MSQDDTPDLATPQAGKVAPEAVALRAQPRPVTRLNRRTLAILAGGLAAAVVVDTQHIVRGIVTLDDPASAERRVREILDNLPKPPTTPSTRPQ